MIWGVVLINTTDPRVHKAFKNPDQAQIENSYIIDFF